VAAARECTHFFDELEHWQKTRGRSNGRLIVPQPVRNPLSGALRAMIEVLSPLKQRFESADAQFELTAFLSRAAALADTVEGLLSVKHADQVYWIEMEQTRVRRVSLCAAPLDPGPALGTLLFGLTKSVVLTSATLSTAGPQPFEYFLQRVGNPPAETLKVGS